MTINDEVEDIAKRNPLVDMEQLKEARALIDDLRNRGVSGPAYEIDPPFGGRPPFPRPDEDDSSPEVARQRHQQHSP